jgi:DNA mismatch endonuclease Vsr
MAAIRGKNTRPELTVRRLLYSKGYRFRLHGKDLPGRPDIVFSARRKIIEIMGCFWHRHPHCSFATNPLTRKDFWRSKFKLNVSRDAENKRLLESLGWCVLVIWECEVDGTDLPERLSSFLGPPRFLRMAPSCGFPRLEKLGMKEL